MSRKSSLQLSDRDDGFVIVNEVPTHVVTYGGWLDTWETNKEKQIVILVIPGNPGMIEYYQLFMETLYTKLDCKIHVIGISHAGHVKVPDNYRIPKLSGNEHLYSLSGQVKHKRIFIEEYLPENCSLILIGHSIGSYISLKLMRHFKNRILKAILLFPTIERLAESPHGKWVWPAVAYFRPLVLILVYILSYLSTPMQYNLLEWYFSGYKNGAIPPCAYMASLNVFDAHCTNKWMYMAKTEMESVNQLDTESVKSNLSKLIIYYGTNDQWCPVSYYENIKEIFPSGDIRLCDKGYDHAFVLHSSVQVGKMVVEWIQS